MKKQSKPEENTIYTWRAQEIPLRDALAGLLDEFRAQQAMADHLADVAMDSDERIACRVSATIWKRAANLLASELDKERLEREKRKP